MLVETYIIAWNEIETIHLTIEHYQKFCDRIMVFDNWSDDGTFEKCLGMGCGVERFGLKGVLDDTQYLKIKNNAWKDSEADWIIVVDSDEILFHSDIRLVLEAEKEAGNTIFRMQGWNVFSNQMPRYDFLEITSGVEDKNYAKLCVFNPKIRNINYVYGCHVAKPEGNVLYTESDLILLHYRNIGGFERLQNRHRLYRKRLSERNKRFGLGCHYSYTDERRANDFKKDLDRSIDLVAVGPEWLA